MYGTWGGSVQKKITEQVAPFRYTVQKGDTLAKIAEKTHTSEEDIRRLNPLVFYNKHSTVYAGQELVVDECLAVSLPPPPELIDHGWGQMHVVRSGDTLESIAKEYNTSTTAIRNDNRQYFPTGERGILFPGQMLLIRIVNNGAFDTKRKVESEPLEGNQLQCLELDPKLKYHHVISDDTFDMICSRYNVTYARLMERNVRLFPTGQRSLLQPGQVLVIGDKHSVDESKRHIGEIVLTKQIHVVENGETPEMIADMYTMTIDELRQYNRHYFPKGYTGAIFPDYKLVVKKKIDTSNQDSDPEN